MVERILKMDTNTTDIHDTYSRPKTICKDLANNIGYNTFMTYWMLYYDEIEVYFLHPEKDPENAVDFRKEFVKQIPPALQKEYNFCFDVSMGSFEEIFNFVLSVCMFTELEIIKLGIVFLNEHGLQPYSLTDNNLTDFINFIAQNMSMFDVFLFLQSQPEDVLLNFAKRKLDQAYHSNEYTAITLT